MTRNSAIIWTLLATLFCGVPGLCLSSLSIATLDMTQSADDTINTIVSICVGFVLLAAAMFVAFKGHEANRLPGITGPVWVTALSGLAQVATALFYFTGIAPKNEAVPAWQAGLSFLSIGLLLLVVAALLRYLASRMEEPTESRPNPPPAG